MKRYSPVLRMALATAIMTTVHLGAPWSMADAQTSSITSVIPPNPATSVVVPPSMSRGVGEVVKLYQAGISKDLIINYINQSGLPYHLSSMT